VLASSVDTKRAPVGFLGDLFLLNPIEPRWTPIQPTSPAAAWPAARKGHGFASGWDGDGGGERLYAFGGLGDAGKHHYSQGNRRSNGIAGFD
jgi:hypothetical protein